MSAAARSGFPIIWEKVRSWFDRTLSTRLNDKANGIIVSIQQRLPEDDLPAYMLEKGYEHLNLPAIAEKKERVLVGPDRWYERSVGALLNPERESRDVLTQLRHDVGAAVFAAQYRQDPVALEGNLIGWEWFGTYDELPQHHDFLTVVQSWDAGMPAAPSSDFSVRTTCGFNRASY